jgi:hypothetical protein
MRTAPRIGRGGSCSVQCRLFLGHSRKGFASSYRSLRKRRKIGKISLQAVHTTFIEYGFPQNSIGIYEIEYGILFTHFKLSIRFPHSPADLDKTLGEQ